MNKIECMTVGKIIKVEGDKMTIQVDGHDQYLVHELMPKLVEMLSPPHLERSVVGMTIQYKFNRSGGLVEMGPWPTYICR
jgi:hypothetical protein